MSRYTSNNRCPGCGKLVSNRSRTGYCPHCCWTLIGKGEKLSVAPLPTCIYCGKKLSYVSATMCHQCCTIHLLPFIRSNNNKGSRHPNWKGGPPHCPVCGKILGYTHKICKKHRLLSARSNPIFFYETIQASSKCTENQKRAVALRVGTRAGPLTLREVGEKLGVTRERARQLIVKATYNIARK